MASFAFWFLSITLHTLPASTSVNIMSSHPHQDFFPLPFLFHHYPHFAFNPVNGLSVLSPILWFLSSISFQTQSEVCREKQSIITGTGTTGHMEVDVPRGPNMDSTSHYTNSNYCKQM
jgi:hypothetical protein